MTRTLILTIVLCLAAPAARAADKDNDEDELDPRKIAELAQAIKPSMVTIEVTLRYDKGQAPDSQFRGGYRSFGGFQSYYSGSGSAVIEEERPMEIPAVLLDDRTAVITDPGTHPRFIKAVAARFGDATVKAEPTAYARDQAAVFFTLARPLPKAKPLTFPAEPGEPAYTVRRSRRGNTWTVHVGRVSRGVVVEQGRRPFLPGMGLVIDEQGRGVGMSMTGRLYLDGSWKGSPLAWPKVASAEMDKLLADARRRTENGLLRVRLNFRSPRKSQPGGMMTMMRYRSGEEGSATERNAIGVLVGPRRVLVLAAMPPKITARLQRVTVFGARGKGVGAKFLHTLKSYGGLVVELDRRLDGALALSDKDVMELEDVLLASARIILHEDKRETYYLRRRIAGYQLGWRKQVYPRLSGSAAGVFLFDRQGKLLVLPVSRRRKVSAREQWGGDKPVATASTYVAGVLASLTGENVDLSNVPLTEQEENRLAWIGVELQAMSPQLARINKVAHLTNGGRTGAMVSYVYPESPAAKAGIEPGDILLRIHLAGHPKPLDVQIEGFGFSGRMAFPWDRFDEMPEQYFDQLPRPWPAVENSLIRALTDNGFGTRYTARFFRGGKTFEKDFAVVQSPPHYDAAQRFKSKALGMTARNLTYEVRRFFQRAKTDPGVIISKVEPGSKASTSGLRPYEIVTHVNDKPVQTAKDFEGLIKDRTELRLSVRRMTRGRIVKITLPAPTVAATQPAG